MIYDQKLVLNDQIFEGNVSIGSFFARTLKEKEVTESLNKSEKIIYRDNQVTISSDTRGITILIIENCIPSFLRIRQAQ